MRLPSLNDWLFSIRTFAAAMTALGIAMLLDLPRPYWALATVYIATQPFAGSTRSKAIFRAAGTIIGGMAALVLVPLLVDAPVLLSLALSLWVGLCLFFALLDRSPRSYVFMLGGYTAAIIGFPSVDTPGAIFDTVLARSEEILIGIGCAALFATLILPRGAAPALNERIGTWLDNADAWALDALSGRADDAAYLAQRRRVGAGVTEIESLSSAAAWDPGIGHGAARAMQALRYDMLLLIPVLSSIDDRIAGLPPAESTDAAAALAATRAWVQAGAAPGEIAALTAALDALDTDTAGRSDWPGLVLASLALRLREYVNLRCACDALRSQAVGLDPAVDAVDVPIALHRDPGMALLSAAGATVAVLLVCTFWIATAWPDGAVAAEMAAIGCCFFAAQDNPVPAIIGFLRWSVVAVIVDAILLFAILPMASSFEMLALAMAPIYLLYGLLMAQPATSFIGIALAANGSTLLGIESAYSADFASFANSGLALLAGMAAAALVTALIRSVGAAWSVRRLQRANWTTLAGAARGYGQGDRERVAGLLLDRLALIAARLAAIGPESTVHQLRPLAETRIGINMIELRRGRLGLPGAARRDVETLMDGLAAYFARLKHEPDGRQPNPLPARLLATLDDALHAVALLPASTAQANVLQGLVGVHRGLCPDRVPSAELLAGAAP